MDKETQTPPCIYQFKVSLHHIKPPIWRRIQVPGDYTFRDLHCAIQCSMGWWNYHLYQFTMPHLYIDLSKIHPLLPREELIISEGDNHFENNIAAETTRISKHFSMETPKAVYTYDLGICWGHNVVLEKVLWKVEGESYPKCIAGRRACPPEDGVESSDSDYEGQVRRPKRDPEAFDPQAVTFDYKKLMITYNDSECSSSSY